MRKFLTKKYTGGQVMLTLVMFFLFLSIALVIGIANPILRHVSIVNENLKSKGSYYAAESALEDVYYRLQNTRQVRATETLSLNGAQVNITVTNTAAGKQVVANGNLNTNYRKLQMQLAKGDGTSFMYGIQAGTGGIVFDNNAEVTGSVYSNGNLTGAENARVTGDAYVAGPTGTLTDLEVGTNGVGNAHAHTVTNSTIQGNLYCQSGSGNNKVCNTSQPDPEVIDMPISDELIEGWKYDAEAGGTINGSYTVSTDTSLGPKKVAGNLTVNATLTLTNTLWVTGNLILDNNAAINLSSSYGASSGLIIVDGYTTLSNNVTFGNSGTAGSYLMLISTSFCDRTMGGAPCYNNDAVELGNNSDLFIVVAQNGSVTFANNSHVREIVAKLIRLDNNSIITYDSGLANVNFTSGPSGGYNITDFAEVQ